MQELADVAPRILRGTIPEINVVPEGLGADRLWLSGGRLALSLAAHGGIEEVLYWGNQPKNRTSILRAQDRSPYFSVLRPYLLIGDLAYVLELHDTAIYPSGYVSKFEAPEQGVSVEHTLIVRSEEIIQSVAILRNEGMRPIALRISLTGQAKEHRLGRVWSEWQGETVPGAFTASAADYSDDEVVTTHIGIVADHGLTCRVFHSGKEFFETGAVTRGVLAVATVFARDEQALEERCLALRQSAWLVAERTVDNWNANLSEAPRLSHNSEEVRSFFRQSPLLLESMMTPDLPGGMRASANSYWVWGWDTMVYCDAYLAAGQTEFVRDALDLYRRTADPVKGIGHAFDPSMRITNYQALCAQGLYIQMLYAYLAFTGDSDTLRENYSFARAIFERTLAQESRDGLFAGRSLMPDFPDYAGHNGHDISTFNNSIFYQAARAMEHLASVMDDPEIARVARNCWQNLETAFRERLWDEEREYWVDSVDSRDFSKRLSYPAYPILWVSPFARELTAGREKQCAAFLAEHVACAGGLRMYPRWDIAFNGDGNQCAQYYPIAADGFFGAMMARAGGDALVARWTGWVEQFWRAHTVPEGVTLEAENDGPHRPDNPGGIQAFSVKAWYMALLSGGVGISFDAGGLTVEPAWNVHAGVDGLRFQNRTWSVSNRGDGRNVTSIEVNGTRIDGSCKLPADAIHGEAVSVVVQRSKSRPFYPQILSADNARLSNITRCGGRLSVALASGAAVRVHFGAPPNSRVVWRGKRIDPLYDPVECTGSILLNPVGSDGVRGELDIICDESGYSL
ncbi:MAG: hypothetical protein P4L33_16080 [Capsulimonadaceae bacterium]|nr:hypothetical protein [Capsulimonadaceae bacterium]